MMSDSFLKASGDVVGVLQADGAQSTSQIAVLVGSEVDVYEWLKWAEESGVIERTDSGHGDLSAAYWNIAAKHQRPPAR